MGILLETKNLSKDVKSEKASLSILKNINLEVNEQEYISIMGKSGSGKSTLLGLLACLDNPSSGSVIISGVDVSKLDENKMIEFRNENIGIVFQSFNLIPTLTAVENIEVPLMFSKKKINTKVRAKELLEMVGLKDRAKTYPRQLSGGEQQRVAIARALANNPKLLLADEPTGALDSQNGENILKLISSFRRTNNMTIVMVTHDKSVAAQADRGVYLKDGEMSEVSSYNE